MTSTQPSFTFRNGVVMPAFGLGVYNSIKADTANAVRTAIDAGYRLIDTAASYQNEAEVGEGIRDSGVPRSEIFVTTKLRAQDSGYDSTLRAFDASMQRLQLDVLDLYLLHWPVPRDFENTMASWNACERLLAEGRVRSIGVCNFTPAHIVRLMEQSDVIPAINQVELHPFFVQRDHDDAHAALGIVTQAWSPIGGIIRNFGGAGTVRDPLLHPAIRQMAEKYGRTVPQIILRWHIQLGHSVIPKSVNAARIRANIDIFDFQIDPADIAKISSLDTGRRSGPDPEIQWTPSGK